MMKYAGKTVLITGASSGIGLEFARETARRKANLILVARSVDKLQQVAKELNRQHNVSVEIIAVDLSKENSANQVQQIVAERNLTVDILVNNAGIAFQGEFAALSAEQNHSQVMLNVASMVNLTHAFLPSMLNRQDGAIINIGSTTSFYPLPFQSVYGATKAFVLSFSEALWAEYRKSGVRVLAICPGATETAFFDAMGSEVKTRKDKPENVVRIGLKALENKRHYVIPGIQNNLESQILPRILPRSILAKLVAKISRAVFIKRESKEEITTNTLNSKQETVF
ncbi:MAG: SDR family oxidoreductase [Pyrinomonadaceae bacterium]|nr:SDR family oxidoreductase [Pyrinomonadaceae bacterium]